MTHLKHNLKVITSRVVHSPPKWRLGKHSEGNGGPSPSVRVQCWAMLTLSLQVDVSTDMSYFQNRIRGLRQPGTSFTQPSAFPRDTLISPPKVMKVQDMELTETIHTYHQFTLKSNDLYPAGLDLVLLRCLAVSKMDP